MRIATASLASTLLFLGLACQDTAPSAPPPSGMAGGVGAGAGVGGGINPGTVAPANPHGVAPANPHGAGPASAPSGMAGDAKVSPFPTVVKGDGATPAAPAMPTKAVVTGTVVETMNAAGYSYMLVKQVSGAEVWVAVNQSEVKAGAAVSVTESLTMNDFHSKALNRTFPAIVFGTLN